MEKSEIIERAEKEMLDNVMKRAKIKKFIKKPIIVEAIRYNGENKVEIQEFMNKYIDNNKRNQLLIPTLEGVMLASVGDYIIKGVSGEFYPCKPDIFRKTYQEVVEE